MEEELREINRALGKIEATQELILEAFKHHDNKDQEQFKTIGERIGAIENKLNYAAGAVGIITFVLTFSMDWIKTRIFG